MVLRAHDFKAEANRCFARAETLDPAEPRWPYHQALELLISDQEAGLACLRRAVAAGGPAASPRLLLGEVLLGLGRTDEAEEQFNRVLGADPTDARAHHGLGRAAYARGELPTSLEHLRAVVAAAPWSKPTHALLAEIYFRRGEESAAADEQRIVDRLPADTPWPDPYVEEVVRLRVGAGSRVGFAAQLLQQGRGGEAVGVLAEAARRDPDSYDTQLSLGKALLRLRPPDYPAAEAAFRRAATLRPDDPAAHFHLGIALEQQGKYREAADAYGTAIRLKPDYAAAHHNRGACLKQLGDQPGALRAFQDAVRYKPDLADSHRELGVLLARSGQDAEALVQLQQALVLNPRDDEARKWAAEVRKRAAGNR
jgi:tetratricopeptide (TPR) repeat protein